MAFVLPAMNVAVGVWRAGSILGDPAPVQFQANLSPGRIVGTDPPEGIGVPIGVGGMWLRCPAGSDVQDIKNGVGPDIVEVPYQSGRWYAARWVDEIGGGFPNEHRFAFLQSLYPWPIPFPPVGGFAPLVPPVFGTLYYFFGTGGVAVNSMTFPGFTTYQGHEHGFIVVYGSPLQPIIRIAGGLDGTLGPPFVAGPMTSMGTTAYIWFFHLTTVSLAAQVTISFPMLGMAAFSFCLFKRLSGFSAPLVDQTAFAGVIPVQLPPYVVNPRTPPIHLACFVQAKADPQVYQFPFGLYGGPLLETIAGQLISVQVGCYPSPIGGSFPAGTTSFLGGPWAGLQVSFL